MEILGKAVTIGDDSREIDRHPPLLGEHTSAVLAEIGFSAEKIEHLRAIGAIADYEAGEMR